LSKDHFFRDLSGKEEEAVQVVDNRIIGSDSINNQILITCDHASRDLKGMQVTDQERPLTLANDAFDPGAADFANYISEKTETMNVMADFSKLIVDPSVALISNDLIPQTYMTDSSIPVSFNSKGF
jgi:predicted N-formylglutamate amidohydrolase